MVFLDKINEIVLLNEERITSWFNKKELEVNIPFYTSVDLRVSENKIAAVDTNIFPGGFNNLSGLFIDKAASLTGQYKAKNHTDKIKNVLIVPEFHTRNSFYWDNILSLIQILEKANLKVKVGLYEGDFGEYEFAASNNQKVLASTIERIDNKIFLKDFEPQLILINNDLSDLSPPILENLDQLVVPPIEVGWHSRKKNIHFEFYNKLVAEFADLLSIDPFTFSLSTKLVEDVSFDIAEDRERLCVLTDEMIKDLSAHYNVKNPLVFIKNNTGTYGMAVMQVQKGEELLALNRDGRKKMKVSKGGSYLNNVIIQEGVETFYQNKEPVYYLINSKVAGGFYRTNDSKNSIQNLNTKGMYFQCLCQDSNNLKCNSTDCGNYLQPSLEAISRIGSLATGYEIEYLLKKNQSSDDSSLSALL
jgi:glutamate--cysteine ligase